MTIEQSFQAHDFTCFCCEEDTTQRCPWCLHAVGWHRCLHRMEKKGLAYADPESYVWKKNTLYHELHDTEVAVLAMLRQGMAREKIQEAITIMYEDGTINADKQTTLLELVQSLSGGLLDTDKVSFSANAQFIAKASQNAATHMTAEEAMHSLHQHEQKFCKLWDESSATYRRYDELGRKPPSQYLALQQLKYRFEHNVPIMIAVAAPAGYGKSQIIMAWLTYLQTQKPIPKWVVLAVTGVAASNAGGTTIHAFFRLRKGQRLFIHFFHFSLWLDHFALPPANTMSREHFFCCYCFAIYITLEIAKYFFTHISVSIHFTNMHPIFPTLSFR